MSNPDEAPGQQSPGLQFCKLLDTPIVVVVEKRAFHIHRGLLCSVSSYFKAALLGGFKEAEEEKIELPEEDPKIFERFQLWLYTKSILDTGELILDIDYNILVGLYLFAESHLVSKLQNEAINSLIRKQELYGKLPSTSAIYKKTVDGSPLRRLVVHLSARQGRLSNWDWDINDENKLWSSKEYLRDLILDLYEEKQKRQERDFWKIRCNYHVHSDADPPCSKP